VGLRRRRGEEGRRAHLRPAAGSLGDRLQRPGALRRRYRCQPDLDGLNAHCQAPGFVFLDKGAVGRALPSTGDPAFVNTDALRPLRVLQ